MKLSKILYIFFIIAISVYFTINYIKQDSNNTISIANPENIFYEKLNHAISLANIKTSNYVYRDFINEVEFRLNNRTQVILSTKVSPYYQIDALQQVLKKAKIDNSDPRLVNLGATHPYATF